MSLLKQLLASVTIIMGLILVGSTAVSVDAVRQYLNGQLQSQSDNTASMLALLLSQPANQDLAIRETLMTALFDSGQFRAIRLKGANEVVLFERTLAPQTDRAAAPEWFLRLLPLKPAEAVRDVTSGWKQVGILSVVVDDASAHEVLWRSSVRLLVLILAVGAAWALLVVLLVRWFKKALSREIRSQLEGLDSNGAAPSASAAFPVPGLKDVSRALQDAKARVQARGRALNERIDSLETEVNHDPVTGLPNRKYFMDRIQRETQEANRATRPYIMLVRQRDLARINSVMTRDEVDKWLYSVGQSIMLALQDKGADVEQYLLARLNGSDFALLMHAADPAEALMKAQSVRRVLDRFRVAVDDGSLCRWAYALAGYQAETNIGETLSSLDVVLMNQESPGDDVIEIIEQVSGGTRG
ncbi:LapD/MoxY N-terminal periplasmic domain-containing protein [Eoetvoesiella caeni]|uniref:diguanylate cyclase n=1 Tax=Eoetvoesiella caeni TaxID=645616 RepID=A0A366H396_9BURK|nr:LapD/MoxY N-terminal periplasmic domain-containing protein [Eoetvoesiella caeni]MCI2809905.1 diguanylate cyclase [Eoetvoesiella caeni]NYT55781.1 diguanylate cyclase [Eoetvoesiella caeni]RBP36443.1 diguanylate cyclase (GGDEF)-like protein [Eoetvoesiella caeni]